MPSADAMPDTGHLMNIDATARYRLGAGYQIDVMVADGQRTVTTHSPDLARVRERVLEAAAAMCASAQIADIAVDSLVFQRPDVGPDGLTVRVIASSYDTPEHVVDPTSVCGLGRAEWWPAEGAWLVAQPGAGTGFVPSEHLDFAPALHPVDRLRFDDALAVMDRAALDQRRKRGRSALDSLLPSIAEQVSKTARCHPGAVLRVGLSSVLVGVLEPVDLAAMTASGVAILPYSRADAAIDDFAIEPVLAG